MADESTNTEEVGEETDVAPLTIDERIAALEAEIAELKSRVGDHTHDGYAGADHEHGGIASDEPVAVVEEVSIQTESTPEPTHPYFRKVGG